MSAYGATDENVIISLVLAWIVSLKTMGNEICEFPMNCWHVVLFILSVILQYCQFLCYFWTLQRDIDSDREKHVPLLQSHNIFF